MDFWESLRLKCEGIKEKNNIAWKISFSKRLRENVKFSLMFQELKKMGNSNVKMWQNLNLLKIKSSNKLN